MKSTDELSALDEPRPWVVPPKLLLAFIAAAVLFSPVLFLLRVPIHSQLQQPATAAAAEGISDISNYAAHAACFAGTFVTALVLFRLMSRRKWPNSTQQCLATCLIILATGMLAWCLPYATTSPTFASISAPLLDRFHEGEVLGLVPYRRAPTAFPKPMLIHGIGMDLMPAWLGAALAPRGFGIAAIRLLIRLLGSASVITFLFALVVIYAEREDGLNLSPSISRVLRCWVAGCWVVATITLSQIGPRRLFFWLQLALVILAGQALRSGTKSGWFESRPQLRTILFVAIGVVIPLSLFYNYGLGVGGACLTLAGLGLLGLRYRLRALPYLLWASLSALATGSGITALIGRSWLPEAARQIAYWSANARNTGFWPGSFKTALSTQSLVVIVTCCILVYSAFAAFRVFLRSKTNFGEAYTSALLLAVAFLELRPYLDRADLDHLQLLTPSFLLIALYALLPFCATHAAPVLQAIPEQQYRPLKWAAIALFGFMGVQSLNPLTTLYRTTRSMRRPVLSDASIIGVEDESVVRELSREVSAGTCFYVFSQSAVWYYLFDRPACSAFYQPIHARSVAAQEEIVSDLRRYRPPIVLAVDRRAPEIDELEISAMCPKVWAYIQQEYEPYKTVAGRDFYRLRRPELRVSGE